MENDIQTDFEAAADEAGFLDEILQAADDGASTALGGYYKDRLGGSVPMGGTIGGPNTGALAEPYSEGAQWDLFESLPTAQRVELQDELANLGFIKGPYRRGMLDDATLNGLSDLLTLANREGLNHSMVLEQERSRIANGGEPMAGMNSSGRVYSLPSTDSLKVNVRNKFREALGRDPTQAEMHLFADSMMGDYQSAVGEQKDAFENTGAGRDVTMTEQDPMASFDLAFEQKYRPEMASNERQAGSLGGAAGAQANVANAANAAGV